MNDLKDFFQSFEFSAVIALPPAYEVYDFSQGYDPNRTRSSPYGIGKYNEKRPGMYQGDLYQNQRDIHVGVDIAAPIATPVHAFFGGEVILSGDNDQPWDYGCTLVTEHRLDKRTLYALWGHLSRSSLEASFVGRRFAAGEVIAWIGDPTENGGWNPHLHFQLSWVRPEKADLPGVVSFLDLKQALEIYPDPRLVLGPLY
jgi:peptidoglycan LD-endopeptidase LytH